MVERRKSPVGARGTSRRGRRNAAPAMADGAPRGTSARTQARSGLWHRPQLLNLLSNTLLFFAAIGLGWVLVTWTYSKPLFPLRELVLSTAPTQVTKAQLEHAARAIQGNFFTARLEEVRVAFEKLPWVRHAEVRRLWPDGLELRLEEHKAVAYWKNTGDGDVRLINRQGEVFGASSDVFMPEFSGPQGSAAVMLKYFEIYSRVLHPLQAKLVRMDLSARGAWSLWLDNGLSIVLAREQEHLPTEARLENFVAALPRLQDNLGVQIARADLRYPNGFALTPVNHRAAKSGADRHIDRK
ncbi:MAG: cell division protein FtsQ/DivIB [Betaproteobacteria bacterium]|nr:cell division protein FtsQ/DivIB [Betaproteobacteria bacterium]